jgi:outer membrane protein
MVALGACAVDQNKEVATYRAVLEEGMPGVVTPAVDEEWTLVKAMVVANKANEQLSIQGEDYLQALIEKARTYSAFMPSASASPSEAFAHTRGGDTNNATSVSAHASMNIFNGFRDWNASKRAAVTVEQQRALLLDVQASLLLSVAETYFQVLRAEASAKVLEDSLALRHEQVRDMQARVDTGIARRLDLAQTQADESATKVALIQAQSDGRNARSTLAFLVGVPAISGPLNDELEAPEPEATPSAEEFERQAMEHRQDLIAARHAVDAAQYSVSIAVGEYYPTISLSFNYLLYTNPLSALLWSGSIAGDIPIFTGGQIRADVRGAWSRFRQAGLNLSHLTRQVHEEVTIDSENLRISDQKIDELHITVAAAQRAFDLSDQTYKLGSATNLDRLTAQNQLLAAQLSLTNEEYNKKVFYLDLLRTSGELVDRVKEKGAAAPTTPPSPPGN